MVRILILSLVLDSKDDMSNVSFLGGLFPIGLTSARARLRK